MTTSRNGRARWARTATAIGGAAILAATAVQGAATADPGSDNANNNTSKKLRQAVSAEGVMEHLEAFQAIADEHGDRASGNPGYAASRDYVVERLEDAGYDPEVQAFDFAYFEQVGAATFERTAPEATTYVEDEDFITMDYAGSGDATAPVEGVDLDLDGNLADSTSGCEDSDFDGFTEGNIALVRRGACAFGVKAVNAQEAGAAGVIIMNTGTEGNTDVYAGTLGEPIGTVPVVGTSFALGEELAAEGTEVHLAMETISEMRETWNVFAETRAGDPDNVVMAGAHLDSVVDGAGINDNGSGSGAILEVAEQMKKVKPKNKVRFAWWGAEENGLLGSWHYVEDLDANDPEALEDIAMYLNFDMVGSPNYGLFVYDGDNSRWPADDEIPAGPEGSGAIEQLFHDFFASQDLPSEETVFSGRSDYQGFIAAGIPSGGLFTGAEGVKTEAQAEAWGGEAGEWYDPCYHQACDDLDNVAMDALEANSDAIAHAVLTYAFDASPVTGEGGGRPVSPPGQHETGTPIGADGEQADGGHDHVAAR